MGVRAKRRDVGRPWCDPRSRGRQAQPLPHDPAVQWVSPGAAGGYAVRMPDIAVTLNEAGEAYVALVTGRPPEVRHSVALDALEEADTIPALEGLVLDFDHYGRLVGLRVTAAADSVLAPSLLEAAESGDPPSAEVS